MMKGILTYSGGMDSTVLLYYLRRLKHEVRCLSVHYGQRHKRELLAAAEIARRLGIEHKIIDLSTITELLKGSSQTDQSVEVPEGHYTAETMKATVVPNRNMILLSLATAWAVSTRSDFVAYAAHAGDHAIYPDCRAEFTEAMDNAIRLCDWHEVHLQMPFIKHTKAEIANEGYHLGVPFELTYSCYKGKEKHCGKCGTCTERIEAFQLAGIKDPTHYEE